MIRHRLLRPWWRNPLVAWRLQAEGIYMWGNLCIVFLMLLFLLGVWLRFNSMVHMEEHISFAPSDQQDGLRSAYGLQPQSLAPEFFSFAPIDHVGIQAQVLAILGLLVIHLLESLRQLVRTSLRWDNPEGDVVRLLPISLQERHFALIDWPRFKASLAVIACTFLMIMIPSRLLPLWPFYTIPFGSLRVGTPLLVSGTYFLALLTLCLLACAWLLHWFGKLSKERGMPMLLDPVTIAGAITVVIAVAHFRSLLYPPTGGISPGNDPLTWGLQLYGGVFATMVAAWVLAAWAKHRYFRLVEKRLAGDG